jgi:D-3-phosphoglycerate dehydrogenase
MTKILLSQEIHPQARKMLEEAQFDVFLPEAPELAAFIRAAAAADGIILRTNLPVTRELIAAAPKLKIISRTGAGVDNVDIEAATERGILVCNLPAVNNLSVAEHTVAMILSLAKDLSGMDKAVRNGAWKQRNSGKPVELEGKTLGVVGMGNIGSLVARKCRHGLGMNILAYDPYAADKFAAEDYRFSSSLEELFREADVITLHCPNLPETKGMINRSLLSLMKGSALFVNCARGEVVDEAALIDALSAGAIAGAALDVLSKEPPAADNKLLTMDNVILSPHSAALTREATVRMSTEAVTAVMDFFGGKRPKYVCNACQLAL